MPDYILEPLDTDPTTILQEFVTYVQDRFPDWQPSEGQLDYIIAQFFSLKIAMTADMASRVLRSIYRYYGASVIGILPIDATYAKGFVTFHITDSTVASVLPSDTIVGITDLNGDIQLFATDNDIGADVGATSVSVGITAIDPGSASNNIQGTVQLVEQVDWISNGSMGASTSDGIDAESDETYLNRLTSNFALMAPRPILAPDFAIISQNIPGVWRASAIDNYLPGPPPVTNAENAVAVAAIDQEGNAISGPTKAALDAYLQSLRQQNFIVNVLDPTYNRVDVTFSARAPRSASPADAQTQAIQALQNYLSPSKWGYPNYPADSRGWENQTKVRYLELTTIVENILTIDYVESLTFNVYTGAPGSGGPQTTTDKTMTGAFPLVQYGLIDGIVKAYDAP